MILGTDIFGLNMRPLKYLYKELNLAKSFHDNMNGCLEEYKEYLLHVKSDGTLVSHGAIIQQFIDYLLNEHLISGFDQISVSICNSRYCTHYRKQNRNLVTKDEMKIILKGFFIFIYGKYGIRNEKVIRGLH